MGGGNAPLFNPGANPPARTPEPGNPPAGNPPGGGNLLRVDPLDIDAPPAVAYRPLRRRLRLWSEEQPLPIVARRLPSIGEAAPRLANSGWTPLRTEPQVASK